MINRVKKDDLSSRIYPVDLFNKFFMNESNVMISGGAGSGKTSLLLAMMNSFRDKNVKITFLSLDFSHELLKLMYKDQFKALLLDSNINIIDEYNLEANNFSNFVESIKDTDYLFIDYLQLMTYSGADFKSMLDILHKYNIKLVVISVLPPSNTVRPDYLDLMDEVLLIED